MHLERKMKADDIVAAFSDTLRGLVLRSFDEAYRDIKPDDRESLGYARRGRAIFELMRDSQALLRKIAQSAQLPEEKP